MLTIPENFEEAFKDSSWQITIENELKLLKSLDMWTKLLVNG